VRARQPLTFGVGGVQPRRIDLCFGIRQGGYCNGDSPCAT
jgi:hypothetical protein